MRALQLPFSLTGIGLLLAASLIPARVQAQDPGQAPAHVAFVDGVASLDREGQTETATAGVPFVVGDRLRTDLGRIEILFPEGSALAIDEFSSIELLSPTLMRLTAGRVLLTVTGANNPSVAVRYQIDTPAASAFTEGPGEYRIAVVSSSTGLYTELAVLRGLAFLATEYGSVRAHAGERTFARDNEAPMHPEVFNSARFDAFDRWVEGRRLDQLRTTASTQYLPDELRMYGGTFDRHGAWQYEQPYGYVWYPTVAFDWRPYYHGYWSSIRRYGWTWIGLEVWSWPTHHYGRWGHARNRWFWIPEKRFGAAWVSWGVSPGYVTWCPLGFDNRPVNVLSVTTGTPWAGWVIVPRRHFGRHLVSQFAVAPDLLDKTTTPFVAVASAPVPPAPRQAVPRAAVVSSASSGRVAIPRNSVASEQSAPAAPQSPVVVAPRSAIDRRTPLANPRSSAAPAGPSDAAQPRPDPQATSDDEMSVRTNSRGAVRRSGPPPAVPLSIDRGGTSAIRQPPIERGESPVRSAQPRGVDERQLRRPPAQALPVPQSPPPVQAPPASERNPVPPVQRTEAPHPLTPEPHREATPRPGRPAEATPHPSVEDGARPRGPAPSVTARPAVPRSRSEGESRSQPSAAPPESARPAAPSQPPRTAIPRGESPRPAAPSAPASSASPRSRSSEEGDGNQGGRQRRR
jgi:hypothetical protein